VLDELNDEALERELARAERSVAAPSPVLGDAPRATYFEGTVQDVRYGFRALRSSPGFTFVAALTLALGVGVNTAIFSVVNAVMLRPLPYGDPDRLVRIWESNPARGWPEFSASQPNFLDWRTQATSWEALAAATGSTFSLARAEGAEVLRGSYVTSDFLPALGVSVVLGRNFRPEEDRPGGNIAVVILSDGYWRRAHGGDPSIIGRTLSLNGRAHVVIGILPSTFQWGANMDLIAPLAPNASQPRGDHRLTVIGRLKPGTTIEQADSELSGIAANLATQFPASNEGWGVRLATFYDWLIPTEMRESLLVLQGSVTLVLLIACVNVANLLLARGAARRKELAIRVAVGASGRRILRQLLVESVLLALLAAAAGVAFASATIRLVTAYGPDSVPRLDEVSLDPVVLLFAVASALVCALIFGIVPALASAKERGDSILAETSRGNTGSVGRHRLRGVLTVVEVGLSVALLVGAGLLLRSFALLQDVDPGFRVESLMSARVMLPGGESFATPQKRVAFWTRLTDELKAIPGVSAVSTGSGVPLTAGNTATEVEVPGQVLADGAQASADWRVVTPEYFATMGIPLRGRDFTFNDGPQAGPYTIVNEALARRHWPNEDALGKTIILRSLGNRAHTVVGVTGDVRSFGLDGEVRPMVYYSGVAVPFVNPMYVVWRGSGDGAQHAAAVREVVRRLDATVALYGITSFEDLLSQSFGPRRFNLYLLGIFAAVAVVLSAIGLFGVMAYLVSQRTREIGVRLALGASRHDVFRLIIGRGLLLTLVGAAVGVAMALWLTRLMQSLLFSVSATDPVTFVTVPVVMMLVALAACYVPARRAMRVDPVVALRAE
jgi:putative ABC transport system permease protein